eukprot:14765613-Ditylum_brightwellii.AAC.1
MEPGTVTYQAISAYMEADHNMENKEKVSFKTMIISDENEENNEPTASSMMNRKSEEENIINFIHPDEEFPLPPLQKVSTKNERGCKCSCCRQNCSDGTINWVISFFER